MTDQHTCDECESTGQNCLAHPAPTDQHTNVADSQPGNASISDHSCNGTGECWTCYPPDVPRDRQCRVEYNPHHRAPQQRIVRCQLPAGHEGDHEETDTGSRWPRADSQPTDVVDLGDRPRSPEEAERIRGYIPVLRTHQRAGAKCMCGLQLAGGETTAHVVHVAEMLAQVDSHGDGQPLRERYMEALRTTCRLHETGGCRRCEQRCDAVLTVRDTELEQLQKAYESACDRAYRAAQRAEHAEAEIERKRAEQDSSGSQPLRERYAHIIHVRTCEECQDEADDGTPTGAFAAADAILAERDAELHQRRDEVQQLQATVAGIQRQYEQLRTERNEARKALADTRTEVRAAASTLLAQGRIDERDRDEILAALDTGSQT